MTSGRPRRLVATTIATTVATAVVLAGCSDSSTPDRPPAPSSGASSGTSSSAATPSKPLPFGKVARPGVGATSVRPATVARPVRVRIPAIGVDSRLVSLGLISDGTLAAPEKFADAGWYAAGVIPGQVGPAIIAGHVDSVAGPAVFFRLDKLERGDQVRVTDSTGHVRTFVVDGSSEYKKAHFPTSTVYAATPDPQLKLITCTGAFDASKRSYVDNLVVTAHLVSG